MMEFCDAPKHVDIALVFSVHLLAPSFHPSI